MTIEASLTFTNQEELEYFQRVIRERRAKSAAVALRYEKLEAMYTSDDAIATRAAVEKMCKVHNV